MMPGFVLMCADWVNCSVNLWSAKKGQNYLN
jgi:hypothetical protein